MSSSSDSEQEEGGPPATTDRRVRSAETVAKSRSQGAVTTLDDLRALGLATPKPTDKTRLVIVLSGKQKRGRTHFALTGDDPIVYIDLNFGSEGVIEKFLKSKDILRHEVPVDRKGGSQEVWKEQFEKSCEVLQTAWRLQEQGTIIVDTSTEWVQLQRLARFGRLEQIPPLQYGPLYAELKGYLADAFSSTMSTIFIEKLKPVYEGNQRTKELEIGGWGDMPYECQMHVRMNREDLKEGGSVFTATIIDSRHASSLTGKEYEGMMCDFALLRDDVLATMAAEMKKLGL